MDILTPLISIGWILILLSFLVIIHEFGHFLAAKWSGVRVDEFGLGYPPRAKALFTWWGTLFTLNWLPLGGFVKLYGDDAERLLEQGESPDGGWEPGAFTLQPQWKRLIIICGGVTVNFIFGAIAFAALYSVQGIPETKQLEHIQVVEVSEGSPAQKSGVVAGESILSVQLPGSSEKREVKALEDFTKPLKGLGGQTVTVELQKEGQSSPRKVELTLRKPEEIPANEGALGIVLTDSQVEYRFYPWWQMPFRGMWLGLADSVQFGRLILNSLGDMVKNIVVKQEVPQDIAGPIGIVHQTVQSGILSEGWIGKVRWMALISINLAIMNLLPIPVLDGGRAVFVILESILGRQRRWRWEQKANSYGFFFLIALVILVTFKDVFVIFR